MLTLQKSPKSSRPQHNQTAGRKQRAYAAGRVAGARGTPAACPAEHAAAALDWEQGRADGASFAARFPDSPFVDPAIVLGVCA